MSTGKIRHNFGYWLHRAGKLFGANGAGTKVLHTLVVLAMVLPSFITFVGVAQAASYVAATEAVAPGEDSPTPTPVVTETATVTPMPTATAIPPPEPTATATVTPTVTVPATEVAPQVPVDITLPLTITVDLPGSVVPGRSFPLEYGIVGWSKERAALDDIQVVITAPDGFTPKGNLLKQYDAIARKLAVTPDAAIGTVGYKVEKRAISGPYTVTVELLVNGEVTDSVSVVIEEYGVFTVNKGGGKALGLGGRVAVEFPAGTLKEDIELRIQPVGEDAPRSLSGNPFSLTAVEKDNGNGNGKGRGPAITKFQKSLVVAYYYDEGDYPGENESDLKMYYFDVEAGYWRQLQNSWVDTENNILYAETDHFTDFDIDVNSWEAGTLPSLEAWQVSPYAGTASYSTGFWVPPGPGGMQPSLSLSYSSANVDNASSQTQASWVGMGWNLDFGYVTRNGSGDEAYFSIVVNGISSSLLPTSEDVDNNPGTKEFRTANETFWRVMKAGDIWYAWDTVGNKYTFGTNSQVAKRCAGEIWKWGLTEMENPHGQKLTYTYFKDTLSPRGCSGNTDAALYPATITYPNNRYQVKFVLGSRMDIDSDWLTTLDVAFERYQLEAIEIWHASATAGVFNDKVRTYDFIYETNPSKQIFPGVVWTYAIDQTPNNPDDGRTLTLVKVQEIAHVGASQYVLPSHTFFYADNMHLTSATNGYGGVVEFVYESVPWFELNAPDSRKASKGACTYTSGNNEDRKGWKKYPGSDLKECNSSKPMRLDDNDNPSGVPGLGYNSDIIKKDSSMFQPGGYYWIKVQLDECCEIDGKAWLGMDPGSGPQFTNDFVQLTGNNHYLETFFLLPADATQAYPALKCEHECVPKGLWVTHLPIRYRVIEKRVTDEVTQDSYSTLFSYDEPATNDEAHSAVVGEAKNWAVNNPSNPNKYNKDSLQAKEFSNFLGHSLVKSTLPSGLVTISLFHQTDDFGGKDYLSLTAAQNYAQNFETTADWAAADEAGWWRSGTGTTDVVRETGDKALRLTKSDSGWLSVQRDGYEVSDGESVLVRFKMKDLDGLLVRLETGTANTSTYRRFGFQMNASNNLISDLMNGTTSYTASLGVTLQQETWYTALFLVGANTFRFWILNDQGGLIYEYTCVEPSCPMNAFRGKTWSTMVSADKLNTATNGYLWLDEYHELNLYSASMSKYQANNTPGWSAYQNPSSNTEGAPQKKFSGSNTWKYLDLKKIRWIRPTESRNYTFEGGADYVATRSTLTYDTADQGGIQYGNVTNAKTWSHNGSGWTAYRESTSGFYPKNTAARYIVSLPGYQNLYGCVSGVCETTNNVNLLTSTWLHYDNASGAPQAYWTAPEKGILMAQRTLVCPTNSSGVCITAFGSEAGQKFADTAFEYDLFGNMKKVKSYLQYGGWAAGGTYAWTQPASYGEQINTTTFDNSYNTYPVQVSNNLGQTTSMAYDWRLGLPVSVTDANNNTVTAGYDAFGRISWVCQVGDNCTTTKTVHLTYSDFNLSSTTGFYTTATQKIDGINTLTVTKFYDGMGRMRQTILHGADIVTTGTSCSASPCNIVTDFDYQKGSTTWVKQSLPYAVNYTASPAIPPADPIAGLTWSETRMDILGRPIKSIATDGSETKTFYDLLSTRMVDANTITTTTKVDIWGQVSEVRPTIGPWTSYTYNKLGQLTRVDKKDFGTSSTHSFTTMTYDFAGRKTGMTDADMGTWSYQYNALGGMTKQTDARGCNTHFAYDNINRLTTKSYSENSSGVCGTIPANANYFYDGLLYQQDFNGASRPVGWTSSTNVDFSGTKVVGTGQGNYNTNTVYGNFPDKSSMQFEFKSDTLGDITNFAASTGVWATSSYQRIALQTENGLLKRYKWQGTSPSASTLMALKANTWYVGKITLNENNNYIVEVWEKDNPAVYASETLSLPTWGGKEWNFQVQWHTGQVHLDNFSLTALNHKGYRTSMVDGTGQTGWVYSNRGQLVRETKTVDGFGSWMSQWNYNIGGQLTSMVYPDGEVVNYAYHKQGSLKSVTGMGGTESYVQSATYDATGRMTQQILGANTITATFNYFGFSEVNGLGRLKSVNYSGATNLLDISYTNGTAPGYDKVGNITNISAVLNGNSESHVYTYDDLYRLSSAQIAGGAAPLAQENYTYDSAGRLAGMPGTGAFAYNAVGHVHAVSATTTGNSYAYDANGNQTTRTIAGDGVYTLSYDAENRLVAVAKGGNPIAQYHYDGDGNQVISTEKGVPTENTVVYIGGHYQVDYEGTLIASAFEFQPVAAGQGGVAGVAGSTPVMGNITAFISQFWAWLNSPTMTVSNGIPSETRSFYGAVMRKVTYLSNGNVDTNEVYFTLGDHLGSASVVAKADGTYHSEMRYGPWGDVRHSAGTLPTDYTYTGQRSEMASIGLMYYKARWYDPKIGHFAQADTYIPNPMSPMAYDRYGYVMNCPTRYTDPSGHCPQPGEAPDSSHLPSAGKGMAWKYLGRYRISAYYIVKESDYSGTGTIPIMVKSGKEIIPTSVNKGMITSLGGIYMEGTARLISGKYIHPEKYWHGQYILKTTGESLKYINRPDLGLVGFVPEKLWNNYQDSGSTKVKNRILLKIQGKTYPWDSSIVGFLYDPNAIYVEGIGARLIPENTVASPRDIDLGTQLYIDGLSGPGGSGNGLSITVTDRGGLVSGYHLDLYVGEGYSAYKEWERSGALNKCYDVWKKVPDKAGKGMQ